MRRDFVPENSRCISNCLLVCEVLKQTFWNMYKLILCKDSAGCIAWTQSGLSFRPPGFNPYIGSEESKVYET